MNVTSRDLPGRIEIAAVPATGAHTEWSSNVTGAFTTTTFVRVETTNGLVGYGATAAYSAHRADYSHAAAMEVLAAGVINSRSLEPAMLTRIIHEMPLLPSSSAVAAIDIALWDLLGQRSQLPLYQLLGGRARPVRGYASMPFLGSIERYIKTMHELRATGYTAFKLHSWCDFERDAQLVRAVSQEFARTELTLMLDVEQSYTRFEASKMARLLEMFDWRWFEAPLPDTDLEGYAQLRRETSVPILNSGNRLLHPRQILEGSQCAAWDAVRFDATVSGGISAARQLNAIAQTFDLPVELQSWGHTLIEAANLHVMLGLTNGEFLEIAVPHAPCEAGALSPLRINAEGYLNVSELPGLGVHIDWDAIVQAAQVYQIVE